MGLSGLSGLEAINYYLSDDLPYDDGLVLWFDAGEIDGLSDGDPVSLWEDQSVTEADVSGVGIVRPLYKVNIVGGKPVVRCDGIDDELITVAQFDLTIGTMIVVVGNISNGAASPSVCSVKAANGGINKRVVTIFPNNTTIFGGDVGDLFANVFNTFIDGVDTNDLGDTGHHVVTQVRTNGPVNFIDLWQVGHSQLNAHLAGDIAEILAYNSALSAENRQKVETWLMRKYGI